MIEVFHVLMWAVIAILPLILVLKVARSKPGATPAAH